MWLTDKSMIECGTANVNTTQAHGRAHQLLLRCACANFRYTQKVCSSLKQFSEMLDSLFVWDCQIREVMKKRILFCSEPMMVEAALSRGGSDRLLPLPTAKSPFALESVHHNNLRKKANSSMSRNRKALRLDVPIDSANLGNFGIAVNTNASS